MERFNNPDKFLSISWDLLTNAAVERKGSYQRPTIATVDNQGIARQRVVVLRHVDQNQRLLTFYTDARSVKVKELEEQPYLSWIFWDENTNVQIRMTGKALLQSGSNQCKTLWEQLPLIAKANYASTQIPGMPQPTDSASLPEGWNTTGNKAIINKAFENFMVVTAQVENIDLLHIHREGHQRAVFNYSDLNWTGQWVTP